MVLKKVGVFYLSPAIILKQICFSLLERNRESRNMILLPNETNCRFGILINNFDIRFNLK